VKCLEVGVVSGDVAVLAADHPERGVHDHARDIGGFVRESQA
jgi:hypothetical protein